MFGGLYSGIAPGYLRYYDYGVSKDSIQNVIDIFLEENPQYRVPEKWKEAYLKRASTFSDDFFIYFNQSPEELYWVKYYRDKMYWQEHPKNSRIVLVGVFTHDEKWNLYDEFKLCYKGKKRIEKRFEKEILSKLKYSYIKVK